MARPFLKHTYSHPARCAPSGPGPAFHGSRLRTGSGRRDTFVTRAVLIAVLLTIASPEVLSQQPGEEQDSLQLQLSSLDVEKAEAMVCKTDFWHRLIPRITFSASLGMKDIVFLDTQSSAPYIFPRDAYRLTMSFSLSEIMNRSDHELAMIEKERRSAEHSILLLRQKSQRQNLLRRASALREEISMAEEESHLQERILAYNRILFERGEIKFDALARSELQCLLAKEKLIRLKYDLQSVSVN
jgi:hypothetical protein